MEKERLPVTIDPIRLAKQRRDLKGVVALKQLPRLQPLLAQDGGEAEVEMRLGYDEEGLPTIGLSIQADLALICQRSLEEFVLPVKVEVTLSPVMDERFAERLPSHYDPIVLPEDGLLSPAELVEDELLLNMPDVPKVGEQEQVSFSTSSQAGAEEDQEGRHPFSVLKSLKETLS